MITIPGTTQHTSAVVGAAWLVALDFASGMQRFTTAPVNITDADGTWLGLGTLAGVGTVSESEEVVGEQVVLTLSIVDRAMVAAALGNVEGYRGRAATIYLQLFDEAFVPVGSKVQRWAGVMERVSIRRDPATDGPSTGSIELMCSRQSISRMRNDKGLRLTAEQQQKRYPGDTGLKYVRSLVEKPDLWLSKDFQAALR